MERIHDDGTEIVLSLMFSRLCKVYIADHPMGGYREVKSSPLRYELTGSTIFVVFLYTATCHRGHSVYKGGKSPRHRHHCIYVCGPM